MLLTAGVCERVRLDWFGIVDDIDACLRALIQATARADPESGQLVEVCGHGCLLGTGVSEQHNIFIYFLNKTVLITAGV